MDDSTVTSAAQLESAENKLNSPNSLGITATIANPPSHKSISHTSQNPSNRKTRYFTRSEDKPIDHGPGDGPPQPAIAHVQSQTEIDIDFTRTTTPTGDKSIRALGDLNVSELLVVLTNLHCPLKARKCIEMVGLNGEGFCSYSRNDMDQIGVKRQTIVEYVLEVRRLLEKFGVRGWMLKVGNKRQWGGSQGCFTLETQSGEVDQVSSALNEYKKGVQKANTGAEKTDHIGECTVPATAPVAAEATGEEKTMKLLVTDTYFSENSSSSNGDALPDLIPTSEGPGEERKRTPDGNRTLNSGGGVEGEKLPKIT